ncbi:MAG: carboxypeptidase regulatory-like domain-containing protein [Gemmatimonadaceae bacterium]
MARETEAKRVARSLISGACALGGLLGASVAAAQGDAGVALTRVSGVVFDSLLTMRPLAGAVVQLVDAERVNTSRSTISGPLGSYAFDSVSAGRYLLGFFHHTLDSLGMSAPVLHVLVQRPGEMRVPLAIPSATTLLQRACGSTEARDSTGLFLGRVRHAAGGESRVADVRVEWMEIVIDARGITHYRPSRSATTGADGAFALCGVPATGTVLVRAWAGQDSSGLVELALPPDGLLQRDIFIGRPANLPSPTDSTIQANPVTATAADTSGRDGVMSGIVRKISGEPIAGARVVVWGSGREVVSNASGAYRLAQLPLGTYTLEARALGYLPQRRAVDILEGDEAVSPIALAAVGTSLDTVRVKATRLYVSPERAAFERRKRMGFGYILDEDDVEQKNAFFMRDFFRMAPGVTIARGAGFGDRILMRGFGFGGTYCAPEVFLDGMRVMNIEGDLDQFINASDVRALEVYSHASSIPAEYQTMNGCGAIVIWSGARRGGR